LFGWAHGISDMVLPIEAGFRFGPSVGGFSHILLDIHYDNPNDLSGLVDESSVSVTYTPNLRPNDAGSLILGDPILTFSSIPANEGAVHYEAECTAACTEQFPNPIIVFASFQHMHMTGSMMWTTQWRNGVRIGSYTNRVEYYNFNFQQGTVVNFTVQPGDHLNTHCMFDTIGRTAPTVFGLSSTDEMCMEFLTYYPRVLTPPPLNDQWNYCGTAGLLGTLCGSDGMLGLGEGLISGENLQNPDPESERTRVFGEKDDTTCPNDKKDGPLDSPGKIAGLAVGVTCAVGLGGFAAYRYRNRRYEEIPR